MSVKSLIAAARTLVSPEPGVPVEHPLEIEEKLNALHSRAPVDRHLDTLCGDMRVGGERFVDLYRRCLQQTGTAVTPFNVFQRFQTRLELLQYFFAGFDVPGARAECGAYRGATALLLCHAWRSRDSAFRGGGMYLVDSFTGTSASVQQDLIPVRGSDDTTRMEPFFPAGKSDTSPELVRSFFGDYPEVTLCAGWIPQAFAKLPERDWSFVHLDVTLYEPTLAALEYFHPRLNPGGVIFCDGSIFCPGARAACDDFSAKHDVPFIVLGHRETVLLKR
jgi:O-methyltransferase